jgi:hypothetical protein
MNLRVTQNAGSFCIVSGTTSLLRKTPLHKVLFGSTILAVYWKGINKLPRETFWVCIANHIYFTANHLEHTVREVFVFRQKHLQNSNHRPLTRRSISKTQITRPMSMRITICGQGYCHFDVVHAHNHCRNTCSSVPTLRRVFARFHLVFVCILSAVPIGEGQRVSSEPIHDMRKWFNDTLCELLERKSDNSSVTRSNRLLIITVKCCWRRW